jgi:hypothetical protein
LTGSGDIDPDNGTLTVRLDPLPTQRATTAITQLCEHLTATNTRYPGTDLILRYQVKTRPHTKYHSMSRPLESGVCHLRSACGYRMKSLIINLSHNMLRNWLTPTGR